ncbi:hypothetical protein C1646_762136 [Rhizophagus diaphanus]|nr:hypothetical protein C1646_762136 [Rhizophagus diaphanus] [Rhizophagus sp. MUCL 43196]
MEQLEDPEKLGSPYFKIRSSLKPENLVKTSIKILDAKSLDVATKIARTFITNTRLEVPIKKIAPFEVEYSKMVNDLDRIKNKCDSRDAFEASNLLKNCQELESHRLQIVEPQLMVENSTELSKKMDNVVTTLSETNEKLSKLIDLMLQKEQDNKKND